MISIRNTRVDALLRMLATLRPFLRMGWRVMNINGGVFRGVDLNALVAFMLIYQERSVSRAAEVLNVGQPAVSNTLNKLRVRFDDPLFVLRGRLMKPTARAEQLATMLSPALSMIETAIETFRASAPRQEAQTAP